MIGEVKVDFFLFLFDGYGITVIVQGCDLILFTHLMDLNCAV
jgi:hypothetical protein